jgi:hypothetical protein
MIIFMLTVVANAPIDTTTIAMATTTTTIDTTTPSPSPPPSNNGLLFLRPIVGFYLRVFVSVHRCL